jgi:hypothetical protein
MACAYRKKLAQHSLRRLIFNWRTTGAERAHFREPTDLPNEPGSLPENGLEGPAALAQGQSAKIGTNRAFRSDHTG